MRWFIFNCLLLTSIAVTCANERPKRSLGFIKDLISSKLQGSNSVVVAQPIFQNQTVKLFSIPGNNKILIKVSNKNKKKSDQHRTTESLIVNPEVAIIGSYLGTKTESETLLAVQVAQSLVQSGILHEHESATQKGITIQEDNNQKPDVVIVEQRNPALKEQVTIITEEVKPVFISPAAPEHIHDVHLVPEVQFNPIASKYSYQQKGENADMTYESFDGHKVFVTRTEKEPPLPKYIKVRIQDVAKIGANPYIIRQPVGIVPGPYMRPIPYTQQPAMTGHVNVLNVPYHTQSYSYGQAQETVKINESKPPKVVNGTPLYTNLPVSASKNGNNAQAIIPIEVQKTDQNAEEHIKKIEKIIENQSFNGNLVSQYVYKQVNSHNPNNYTKVNIDNVVSATPETVKEIPKDYVYVPPNNIQFNKDGSAVTSQANSNLYTSKPSVLSNVKTCCENIQKLIDLRMNPIVVSDIKSEKRGDLSDTS